MNAESQKRMVEKFIRDWKWYQKQGPKLIGEAYRLGICPESLTFDGVSKASNEILDNARKKLGGE